MVAEGDLQKEDVGAEEDDDDDDELGVGVDGGGVVRQGHVDLMWFNWCFFIHCSNCMTVLFTITINKTLYLGIIFK